MSRSDARQVTMKPKETEAQIQRAVLEYLKLRGVFCWRQNTGSFRMNYNGKDRYIKVGFPGISDILGILPRWWYPGGKSGLVRAIGTPTSIPPDVGQFIAIEVKRPGQKPTLDQQAFLAAVKANGGIAFVATSIDDVRKGLGL